MTALKFAAALLFGTGALTAGTLFAVGEPLDDVGACPPAGCRAMVSPCTGSACTATCDAPGVASCCDAAGYYAEAAPACCEPGECCGGTVCGGVSACCETACCEADCCETAACEIDCPASCTGPGADCCEPAGCCEDAAATCCDGPGCCETVPATAVAVCSAGSRPAAARAARTSRAVIIGGSAALSGSVAEITSGEDLDLLGACFAWLDACEKMADPASWCRLRVSRFDGAAETVVYEASGRKAVAAVAAEFFADCPLADCCSSAKTCTPAKTRSAAKSCAAGCDCATEMCGCSGTGTPCGEASGTQLAVLTDSYDAAMDDRRFVDALAIAEQARKLAPEASQLELMVWKAKYARREAICSRAVAAYDECALAPIAEPAPARTAEAASHASTANATIVPAIYAAAAPVPAIPAGTFTRRMNDQTVTVTFAPAGPTAGTFAGTCTVPNGRCSLTFRGDCTATRDGLIYGVVCSAKTCDAAGGGDPMAKMTVESFCRTLIDQPFALRCRVEPAADGEPASMTLTDVKFAGIGIVGTPGPGEPAHLFLTMFSGAYEAE